jgi:hypothetical protein
VLSWSCSKQTDRLFDRKIGRLGTPEYLVHGAGRASELFDVARRVTLEVLWSHTITGAPRMAIDALSYIRSERMLCRETRV